jgi:hypothetical protein
MLEFYYISAKNASNHKNCDKKNANHQVHVNITRKLMTCYSLFIEDPFLSLFFHYNFVNLVISCNSFDHFCNMVICVQLLVVNVKLNYVDHKFILSDFTQSNSQIQTCKYVNRNQGNYFIKGLWIFFSPFHFFMKEFLNEFFCNLLLIIHIIAPTYHIFCVNHHWINMNFSKCVNSTFHLENLSLFWIIQKDLTTLGFCFLYPKLQLCFVFHARYTLFTCGKGL